MTGEMIPSQQEQMCFCPPTSHPTVLHQGLDLVRQRQRTELGHGQHITGTNRLHANNTKPADVKGTARFCPQNFAQTMRKTYIFSSARGGINIDRYSLQEHVETSFSRTDFDDGLNQSKHEASDVSKNHVVICSTHFGVLTSSEFSEVSTDWQNRY